MSQEVPHKRKCRDSTSSDDSHQQEHQLQTELQPPMKRSNRPDRSSNDSRENENSIDDLPIEIMCLIFSFKYGSKFAPNSSKDGVHLLFRTFGLASPSLRQSCRLFVQRTHFSINVEALNPANAVWLATQQVKIGALRVGNDTTLQIGMTLYLLTSCDIKALANVRIVSGVPPRSTPIAELRKAWADGIPRTYANSTRITLVDFHAQISDILTGNRCPLTKMELNIEKGKWYPPILMNFAETLQELVLKIGASGQVYQGETERQLKKVTQAISYLRNLKKLQLRTWFPSHLHIRSKSLEEIDTYYAHDKFWVVECLCPSLKFFKCRNFVQFHECKNGVTPVTQFKESELKLLRHEGGVERWYDRPSIDFRVGDRPFLGMKVGDDCVVRVRC